LKIIIASWRSRRLSAQSPDEEVRQIGALPPEEEAAANLENGRDKAEGNLIASGRDVEALKAEALANEHRREQKFKDVFEWVAMAGLVLMSFALAAVGVTWLYHVLSPESWHWLDDDGLTKLQNIFTGGILASAAADHWRKRMK
jgi:hypothetical protein